MNYPANTRRWQLGAIVIHDADAKQVEMLMRVTGYNPRTGECQTVYVQSDYLPGMDRPCENDIKFLHDPRKFGLQAKQADQNKAIER